MTTQEEVFRTLIDALWVQPPVEPPKYFAHYTTLSTLEKILEKQEIWFSNPLYMNDLEELRFGMSEGATAFRQSRSIQDACAGTKEHEFLLDAFETMYAKFENQQALDVYVLCLSAHAEGDSDGQLSMWRGYGNEGTGAAIIFDSAAFDKFDHLPLQTIQVEYGTRDSRRSKLAAKLDALAAEIGKLERTDYNLHLAAFVWIEFIKRFSISTKHSGFAEEREWRVVYFKDRDYKDRLVNAVSYALTTRGIEPKLKLRRELVDEGLTPPTTILDLIAHIILGPSHSNELAKSSARRMAECVNLPQLAPRIVASGIPYRSRIAGHPV